MNKHTEIVLTTYSIFKGKQHYRKQAVLDIEFSGTKDDDKFIVEIIFDGRVLLSQSLTTQTTKLIHMIDDHPGEHHLQIVMSGTASGSMLHLHHILIEGLSMRNTMENSGTCVMAGVDHIPSEYMGQPGFQSLKFTTPIYPWLFENERNDQYYL